MNQGREPDLKRALRPGSTYERAVREVSRMLSEAGIRHALVGALAANAYRSRPRTTEGIDFLVGDEAFQRHAGGFVTMRVPVVEVDGIDIDQVPLTVALRVVEDGLNHAGADREWLRAEVRRAVPDRDGTLERLFDNVDRGR